MMGLGEVLYETSDIAYDTVTKKYLNPKTGAVYGDVPPAGGWAVNWYQGADNVPVIVNAIPQAETVAQIQSSLVAQKAAVTPIVTTTGGSVVSTSWLDGSTFGVSNMMLLVGVVGIGGLMFIGKKGGR